MRDSLVLLVEDHADTREMYAFDLAMAGFNVAVAADASEGLGTITHTKPDVVVTNLHLPGIDGLSFCRTLKADPATADLPVIAVTGASDPRTLVDVESAGFATVLVKPCIPSDLRREIARVLAFSRATRARGVMARTRSAALRRKSQRLHERSTSLQARITRYLGQSRDPLVVRMRGHFIEMPGLSLTPEQAARLMGIDLISVTATLEQLTRDGFLRATGIGTYLRSHAGSCVFCRGTGWVCEQHPTKPIDHDDCSGPWQPCAHPDCPVRREWLQPPGWTSLVKL